MLYEFMPLGELASGRATVSARVMLIPGFMSADPSLYPLGLGLRMAGHRIYFPGIWLNVDCPRKTIERLSAMLEDMTTRGGEPVALVGHSLGGIFARALARRYPQRVSQTFLLGSAVRDPLANSNTYVRAIYLSSRRRHAEGGSCVEHLASLCGVHEEKPSGVPQTIIYTRSDHVVDWRACIETGENIEVLEVGGSHNGLPYRPEVLAIIKERLKSPRFGDAR